MKTAINAFELTFLVVFILALGATPALFTFRMFTTKYGLQSGGLVYAGVTLTSATLAVLLARGFVKLCRKI